jgi:hypothetical protein
MRSKRRRKSITRIKREAKTMHNINIGINMKARRIKKRRTKRKH